MECCYEGPWIEDHAWFAEQAWSWEALCSRTVVAPFALADACTDSEAREAAESATREWSTNEPPADARMQRKLMCFGPCTFSNYAEHAASL